jgi:hypothetical protein
MTTEQTEASTTGVDDASAATAPNPPARNVDGFLADLDTVLTAATAPAIPIPAIEPDSAVIAEPPAGAGPEPASATGPEQNRDWWDPLYRDDKADLDTFTGNAPNEAPVPLKPAFAPDLPAEENDADDPDDESARAESRRSRKKKDQVDDEEGGGADDGASSKKVAKNSAMKSAKATGAALVAAGDGAINNPQGRQVIFAGTAYGLGWSLHLDDWFIRAMEHAAQYATPVAGCALAAGVVGLCTRTKFGGFVFVSSLTVITALEMVDPARIVGGGLALGLQIAYRGFRRWMSPYGAKWPWAAVAWFAHVPAATASVAFVLYGTN